jgi:transcriptional regulator with XRE-family HTH domain
MGGKPEDVTGRELICRQLKRLRESLGMSMQQFADEFNYSKGRIADMESGRKLPSLPFAEKLDQRYKPMLTFVELLANVRDALVAEHMRELLPHEQKAARIQTFTSSVVPGLLQTEHYAWALSRESMPGATDHEISQRVSLRMDRQDVFKRDEPPFYRAVVDESALARPVGSTSVMAKQLQALLTLQEKPRNEVLILPFRAGAHGLQGGSLNLWHLEDGRAVALVESFGPGEPIENPAKVTFYSEMFDAVKIAALPQEESLELVRRYLEGYENE